MFTNWNRINKLKILLMENSPEKKNVVSSGDRHALTAVSIFFFPYILRKSFVFCDFFFVM